MNRHFSKENTDGTQAQDKTLHVTHHCGIASQNRSETSLHTC